MKKRYQATIHLLQNDLTTGHVNSQIYKQKTFRYWVLAFGYIIFYMIGTGDLVQTGLITFETEINEICA